MYWLLIPEHKRRKCLFKKSCSNYVYDKTKSEGFISGLKALRFRIDNCNPNYSIMELDKEIVLITKMNNIINKKEINQSILNNQQ
tara:strand:- start:16886 stop:17140 length:255 start_codon:yes stop_codon:yes gene_type:complete